MISAALSLLTLLHDDRIDLIYFWSSIVMVVIPLAIFITLTYLMVKAYRKRERGAGSGT